MVILGILWKQHKVINYSYLVTHIWLNNHRKWRHYTQWNENGSHSCFLIPSSVEYPWCLQLQSNDKVLWTSCNQAGFSSWSSSASSLSSLTIPSSMLSSLSLWPSRYLGLGPALVLKIPPVRLRSSPNKVSLASFSIAFARQDAKASRDLWTSAWIWMDVGLSFSARKKKKIRSLKFSTALIHCKDVVKDTYLWNAPPDLQKWPSSSSSQTGCYHGADDGRSRLWRNSPTASHRCLRGGQYRQQRRLCEQQWTFVTQLALPPKPWSVLPSVLWSRNMKLNRSNVAWEPHQQPHPNLGFTTDTILLQFSILNGTWRILALFQQEN